jgi:methylenetetrahydrofolate dehydrogenase (NADP+)/methenyltetrahydrofolate cyclohydrolase
VDGFGVEHMGVLAGGVAKASGDSAVVPFVPCTAAGILQLLDHYSLPISGKHVVIVGRSPIVGTPAQVRRACALSPPLRAAHACVRVRAATVW